MTIKVSKLYSFIFYFLIVVEVINASILPMITPIPSSAIALSMYGGMALVFVFYRKGIHINLLMLLVVLSAAISLILNDYDEKFSPVFRLYAWIMLIATVGPLIYNADLVRFRYKLLEGFMVVFMWMGAISFLYWLVGLHSLGRGHFAGLFNHSMLLAPFASMGALYAFYKFINAPKRSKKRLLFFTLFMFGSMSVLLSSSRIAFIAYMLAFFVYLIFNNFPYRRILMVVVLTLTIAISSQMSDSESEGGHSDSSSVSGGLVNRGMTNTRDVLWANRLIEFKSSPLYGVGFATQDESIITLDKMYYNIEFSSKSGRLETGSGYLMILSMTGLLGAISMILLFTKIFISRNFWRRVTIEESYKLALYVFFSVHFIAEGYIYSSGSPLSFIFWLLVGATFPYAKINYKQIFSNKSR